MSFYTLFTDVGAALLANAMALGDELNITHFAVGDGNGSEYEPTTAQTALLNETYRGAVNNKSIDPENPNWAIVEGYIPAAVGGFTVREAGLFDDQGRMVAIAKYPESYKPVIAEGAGKDLHIRLIMETSNVSVITLAVDPAIVLASQVFVNNALSNQNIGDHNDTTLAGLSAGDGLVYDGTKWVNGDPAASLRKKILLNTLLHSMADQAAISAIDALADGLADDSNIDAVASTGWAYDAANDLIKSSAEWSGDSVSMTAGRFGAHTQWDNDGVFMSATFGAGYVDSFWDPDDNFAGEFDFEFTYVNSNGGGGPTGLFFCLVPDAEIAALTASAYDWGKFGLSIGGGGGASSVQVDGSSSGSTVPVNGGDTVILRRLSDGRFQVLVNGAIEYTSTFTFTGNLRPVISLSHNSTSTVARSFRINDISVTEPGNMSLVSKSLEASAEPDRGYLLAIVEGVFSLGTDWLADLSKDDGTTWEALALSQVGETDDGYPIVFGEVEFSVTGDQTLRWRIVTANQVNTKLHGVIFDAEL